MKTIIAGGRAYKFDASDYERLQQLDISEVFSGGATGADDCAESWADEKGIPVRRFNADWGAHGRAAGPIRNEAMASHAEACVLFPGGKGTADMAARAKKHNLKIYDYR